jgi:translation initiation factor 2 beta subunit (eIF-2beta)/eIF-5
MLVLKTKVGKTVLEFEAADLKQACKISALVGMFPDKCSECGSDDIILTHKSPGGNDYYGLRCKGCGAEQNFHQRKEGGFYITADDKFSIYNPEKSAPAPSGDVPPEDLF